jgi:hypothetical protein
LIVVIKGKSVAGANRLTSHLERTDTNERMEVKELRGIAAEDLRGALREMEAVASACPNCERPFYHASINTQAHEYMTPEQQTQAIDRLEKELGLTGQPRAVVAHVKEGREHFHIVWSRIDTDTMRTISDSHNYRRHEIVARELEREFGHERVQGAHIEREGKERPERTPSHKEMQQAARTKIKPDAARDHITALWRGTENGQDFAAALEKSGWTLARGDRRDFVVIDPKGGTHSLARRIEGAKLADVRARMVDVDMSKLPSVAEGKAAQLAKGRDSAAPNRQPAKQPTKLPIRVIGGIARPAAGVARGMARPAASAMKAAGKIAEGVATAFEGLFGGGSSKPAKKAKDYEQAPLDAGNVPTQAEIDAASRQEHEQRSATRQKYLKDFSREVPEEAQRDADIERDKGRERQRGE